MSDVTDFITRWKASGGSEQANSQLFLSELCDVLELPRPDPASPVNEDNAYCFERKIPAPRDDRKSTYNKIDLYRKGCFVLESKQGQDKGSSLALSGVTTSAAVNRGTRSWEEAMQKARRQGENYIHALPVREGRPPFLIVVDVGYCFDFYAEFSCTGGAYLRFPDARAFRVMLDDLERPEVRAFFQTLWNDPLSLDPSRRAARVTEEIAGHLAVLAKLLEADGHDPERVSQFLMRCIFSMFAEDVSLIPAESFTDILENAIAQPKVSQPIAYETLIRDLWGAMSDGRFSANLKQKLLCFNGSLFADLDVLPLEREQMGILLEAARADWREVEPAIFGTLLERALDSRERHKLGAHYTPRAYVERLVIPTVIKPLRDEWDDVQAAASLLSSYGKEVEARKTVDDFYKRLLNIRVLDPACGSGNFLYVTLEHMKRLEGEVLQTLESYGEKQHNLLPVDPHQFLGLEINPRAAHIAEMVLWIGYLQWHFRTHGYVDPPEPIIRKFDNIQNRDALLVFTRKRPAQDENGNPITRWDGETFKTDSATGREVPDESATVVDEVYEGVTQAKWPDADFIVGNPPFIGGKDKRQTLGHGYFDALTKAYGELPESCDFVMYWWHKAAELARLGKARRFGFITTNSITQVFNRRVVEAHLKKDKDPLRLVFAVPDHPWVDAADGAAVRIAMTVGEKGTGDGVLARVVKERKTEGRERAVVLEEKRSVLHADLRHGVDITQACRLKSNDELCCPGMKLHGSGFIVTPAEAKFLGLGSVPGLARHIRPYRNGRDLANGLRGVMVLDLFGLTEKELQDKYPKVYQWVLTRVKPARDANNRASYRSNWWVFGEPRKDFRPALVGLSRYIATIETAKHRFFMFLPAEILPDNMLVNVASADAFHLGVLSSRIHVCWALNSGGRLGMGPRYNKSRCFDPFPFPDATPAQQARIRELGEKLDAFRKARQKEHPGLTMTGLYNVLGARREGRELTREEKNIFENGLVGILQKDHDDLDAAVFEAYGWPDTLSDEEILTRLVALNAERIEEEKNGQIRYLRPEYQKKPKSERKMVQEALVLDAPEEATGKGKKSKSAKTKAPAKTPWPSTLLEQTQVVRRVINALRERGMEATPESIAGCFTRAPRAKVGEILEVLQAHGFITT